MSSSNMDEIHEIIQQELSAFADGFGDNANGNNVSDNNMLNEDSIPLEDLGDFYDSDFEMTPEDYEVEFYESDDPTENNGPWSLPQQSPSPNNARLRLLDAEYARYIRDADDEVWLTQGHFQDESLQSGQEFPLNQPLSSPKPPYDDYDESDAKVPEYHS